MQGSAESTPVEPQPPIASSRSRRALLAGAVGGIGAWAASVVGRTSPVRANDPNDVVLGATNSTTTTTQITNTTTGSPSTAFRGISNGTGEGVWGQSNGGGAGVFGYSPGGTTSTGVSGVAYGNGCGVRGTSSDVPGSAAGKTKTGVFGYANQDSGARGVWGQSPVGIGVYGATSTGYAGYFSGKVFSTSFYELEEIATPGAPGANKARLFIRDDGSGKSQLCVRFATGSVKLLASQ